MRLNLALTVAVSFAVLFFYVIVQPAQAYPARTVGVVDTSYLRSESISSHFSIAQPLTTTVPVVTPTVTVSATVAPTAVTPSVMPQTALMPATPTITPTAILTSSIGQLLYLPAIVRSDPSSPQGVSGEPCGPFTASPSLTIEPTSTPAPPALPVDICPPNSQESELANFLINSPDQARTALAYNPILAQIARNHAADQIARGYVGSLSPEGVGANERLRQAGYELPDAYDQSRSGNSVETVMAGFPTAAELWSAAVARQSQHLLGLGDFYQNQTEYGIGYAFGNGSDYTRYWVILIAQPTEVE